MTSDNTAFDRTLDQESWVASRMYGQAVKSLIWLALQNEIPKAEFECLYDIDKPHLRKFYEELQEELAKEPRESSVGGDVFNLVHEWHETALVVKSGVLDYVKVGETNEQVICGECGGTGVLINDGPYSPCDDCQS
jgi:hypothetical protein